MHYHLHSTLSLCHALSDHFPDPESAIDLETATETARAMVAAMAMAMATTRLASGYRLKAFLHTEAGKHDLSST